MTIRDLLLQSSIERTDAELLAAHALGKTRSWILAHDDEDVSDGVTSQVASMMKRRQGEEPLAYIICSKEFYGRDFFVRPDVLIPRPATEHLVEDVLLFLRGKNPVTHEIDRGISSFILRLRGETPKVLVDIGTGSGCIAITLALEGCGQSIIGVDTSPKALEVAEKNRKEFETENVRFVLDDGIDFVRSMAEPFLLVSNPPYIPSGTRLGKTVAQFEPHEALFAGEDGMEVITPLLKAARENEKCIGAILEMRSEQAQSLTPQAFA